MFIFTHLRIDVNGYRFVAICCLHSVNPHDDMTIQTWTDCDLFVVVKNWYLADHDRLSVLWKWREISNVLTRHQEFNMVWCSNHESCFYLHSHFHVPFSTHKTPLTNYLSHCSLGCDVTMSEKKVMFTSGEMLASIFDVIQGSDLTKKKQKTHWHSWLPMLNRNKNKNSFT